MALDGINAQNLVYSNSNKNIKVDDLVNQKDGITVDDLASKGDGVITTDSIWGDGNIYNPIIIPSDDGTFFDKIRENAREAQYGEKPDDMTLGEYKEFQKAKAESKLNGDAKSSPEPGVTQTKYGDYTETKIDLYNGKKYSELSKSDQARVDDWEKECDRIEQYNKEHGSHVSKPECPFDYESETRIAKNKKILFNPIDIIKGGIKSPYYL